MVRPEITRAQNHVFIGSCSFCAQLERLPFAWQTSPDIPPSPKLSYRSSYQYLGYDELQDPAFWQDCDDFDLLLRLVDFSGLRDMLAEQLGWTSAQGQVPFDPVSLWLLTFWQIRNGWSRAETLRNLRKDRTLPHLPS